MRLAIVSLLKAGVPDVGGRVFQPHSVDRSTAKPFLVVREGVADPGQDWSNLSTPVEVWPFIAQGSFVTIDALVARIIETLHRAQFEEGGAQYLVDYEGGAGEDQYSEPWDALTRPQRFRVYHLGWLSGLTYDPDPVAALRSWTATAFPEVQTDPASWDPSDVNPAVYWRLVDLSLDDASGAVRWYRAVLRAHVLAPAAMVRLTYVRKLVEGLGAVPGMRVTLTDGGPLLFRDIAGDSEADPMRVGQVSLTARFGVLVRRPAASTLAQVTISGDVQGVVT